MKARDINLGNWLDNGEGGQYVMDTSSMIDIMDEAQMNDGETSWQPIPLTEEWLVKFGFDSVKPRSGIAASYKRGGLRINISNSGNFYFDSKPVRYVHILQNLFYFHELTGQELTIKEQ